MTHTTYTIQTETRRFQTTDCERAETHARDGDRVTAVTSAE